MYPELVRLFGGGLHTYGVLIAVGFLLAVVMTTRQARREGTDPDRLLDLGFWLLVGGFVGARLLFILTDLGYYVGSCRGTGSARTTGQVVWDCTRALHVWEGGLVWYGGFLAALGVGVFVLHRRRMKILRTADLIMPSVPLGHFFGRLGCFAAGCCFGKPTSSALGVAFGPRSLAYSDLGDLLPSGAAATMPLHPTQLYEAFGELLIFFWLLGLGRRKRFDGQVLLAYLFVYPLLRTVVEVFRGDAARRHVVAFSTRGLNALLGLPPEAPSFLSVSQLISLLVAAGALGLWLLLRRQRAASVAAPAP
ncbi:MAG: prolipoprotein diacylglyceryl transferase [Deltaproteobacteria bacterium]|nr:prolipoprotein diacylglyceryl transferase [Deltaproteobacteria bacterium]